MKTYLLSLTCLVASIMHLQAQVPYLVRDISIGTDSSFNSTYPFDTAWTEGNAIFFVTDKALWKSEGDSASTTMIKEISPAGFLNADSFFIYNGKHYFLAENTTLGRELWVSDGTESGTYFVKNIGPGSADGFIRYIRVVNNKILFRASSVNHEVWVSDGTETGTFVLKEIGAGNTGSDPRNFFVFNNKLFFTAEDSLSTGLWVTDGTTQGTIKLMSTNPASTPIEYFVYNNQLFYVENVQGIGRELWTTNGTVAGTLLLKEIRIGSQSSNPTDFYIFDNKLFFTANDNINGRELWVSDGTNAGTNLFKDINTGAFSSFTYQGDDYKFKVVWEKNGYFYFLTNSSGNNIELWKSDGTANGTVQLKDINPGNYSSLPQQFAEINDKLYFLATDSIDEKELWYTDGTTAGTRKLKNINPIESGFRNHDFKVVWKKGNEFYFTAASYRSIYRYDLELWKSDGTEAGTVRVKDIYEGWKGSDPDGFYELNGKLLFSAADSINGKELWISDGTDAGTYMVKDFMLGDISWAVSYTPHSGFASYTVGPNYFPLYSYFIKDEYMFFQVNSSPDTNKHNNIEMWKTDGTEVGTTQVLDIYEGMNGSYPKRCIEFNGDIYFSAVDSAHGHELWVFKNIRQNTGIRETEKATLNIYPNPTETKLYINSSKDIRALEVYSVTGNAVSNTSVINSSIDVSELPAGMYLIHFTMVDGEVAIRKFIKAD